MLFLEKGVILMLVEQKELIEVQQEQGQKVEVKSKGWWNTEKQFDLGVENNQVYWEEFKKSKWGESPDDKQILSMRQYKSSVMNFMQFLGKDILTASRNEINAFLSTVANETTRINKQAHIKSILVFIIQKNIMGAMGRASKNTLLTILLL
jgi:hypothetical protein